VLQGRDLGLKPFGESPSIIDLLVAYFRTKFLRNVESFLTIMNYPAASSGVSSKALNAPRGGEYNPCEI